MVNDRGDIRIGLSAMKNIGEGVVEEIILEREQNGPFQSPFELVKRVNPRVFNKKCLENLVLGGALDCFPDINRAQYFKQSDKFETFIEHILKYGQAYQQLVEDNTNSLFGDSHDITLPEPKVPAKEEWGLMEKLNNEKEIIGIYASGHPLDSYKLELENYVNCELVHFDRVKANGRKLKVAGIITKAIHAVNKRGLGYARFTLQDYNDSIEMNVFNDDYQKFKGFITEGQVVFIEGIFKSRYQSDELFFQPLMIRLLATVGEEMTKCITIKIPLAKLTEPFLTDLNLACAESEGNHSLRFVVQDEEDDSTVHFFSQNKKVLVDSHFVNKIEKLGVPYKLN